MNHISDNVMKIIFSFLPLRDHVNLGNTCKWAHKVSTHPYSFAHDYGHSLLPHHIKYLGRHSARVKFIYINNDITDKELVHLKSLVNLQTLDLYYCERITDEGLVPLKSLVNLQRLCLWRCERITDKGFGHLKSLVNLQDPELSKCSHITDDKISVYFASLLNIQKLDLSGRYCTNCAICCF